MRTNSQSSVRTVRASIAAGRFVVPTIEHEKLFDRLMEINDDYKFIFVFGPDHIDKVTAKDPLLLSEKQHILRKTLPADVFQHVIFGDHQYTSSLFQALINVYNRVKTVPPQAIHLNVVGGDGTEGVTGSEGASADEYLEILGRANHSTYPNGVTRMAFNTIEYHRQPRGKISGTKVRQAACSYNYKSEEDVAAFVKMLHSGMNPNLARGLIKLIQERTNGVNQPTK